MTVEIARSATSDPAEVTIGVVTALACECAAIRALVDGLRRVTTWGDPNHYFAASWPSLDPLRPHQVAITVLPRDGSKDASAVCADLIRSFPTIRCVIMCGIAGGVPSPSLPRRHVRLGDVVVGVEGVVDYDHVRTVDGVDTLRRSPHGLSMDLARAAKELQILEYSGVRPWEQWLEPNRSEERRQFARPPDHTDVLYRGGEVVAHPARARSGHAPGMPKIHHGAIASADRLLRDEARRDDLARRYGVCAVEMETSGIAAGVELHGRQWFVVRGIADYCENAGKNDLWHPYASLAAAAYLRALVAQCPPFSAAPGPRAAVRQRDGSSREARETVPGLVDVLLAIPHMANAQSRDTILSLMPPAISTTIDRRRAAREDIIQILRTCFDHDEGLVRLLEAIQAVSGTTLTVRAALDAFSPYLVAGNGGAGDARFPGVTRDR